MTKQEIFKLQLDAFIRPHLMWRHEIDVNSKVKDWNGVKALPDEELKEISLWEWDVDVQHDAHYAFFVSCPHVFKGVCEDTLESFLIASSPLDNKLKHYEEISNEDYVDLMFYIEDKLYKEIREDLVFTPEIFDFFLDVYISQKPDLVNWKHNYLLAD